MGMMVWKLATKIRSRALKGLKYFPNRAPNWLDPMLKVFKMNRSQIQQIEIPGLIVVWYDRFMIVYLYDSYMVPHKVATAFLCEQQSFAASIFCLDSRFSCKTIGAAWKKRKLQIVLENWSNQVLPWKQGHLFAATTNSLISPWWRKIMFTPRMKQMDFVWK
jgi:hypothetical protein